MNITVDCVWCSNRREFTKFLKTANNYEAVIDYYAIMVKLSKSDPHGIEPPSTVIGLHLIKSLHDAKNNNKKNLLYVIKNLDAETIETVSGMFFDIFETEDIQFNLIIVNREDYPKKGVLSKFKNVRFIEKENI